MMRDARAPLCLGAPRFPAELEAGWPAGLDVAERWRRTVQALGPEQACRQVQGNFALALPLPDGQMLLAVDRFAVRSLCWRVLAGEVHAAPRADELAGLAPTAALDLQALFNYLYHHVIPSPRTVFEGVWRLPAGHYLLCKGSDVACRPYWVPEFQEPAGAEFEPSAKRFRELLEQAVATELDGSKPACFLSGGTDSSTVAGMVGRAAGRAAATYSIGFEAEGYDEMTFARIAARHFGTEHHEYYVTPADLIRSVPEVAASYDQPFGNSSVLPAYYCARMARDTGATRLLAGDGGDELFGGNSRYAKQRVFGWYGQVPGVLRHAVLEPLLLRTPLGGLPLARKGRSYIEQAQQPMPDRYQPYNLIIRQGLDLVFTRSFLAEVDPAAPVRQQREVWAAARTGDELNRELAYDWRYTLAEADLPKVCGSTALAGVSVGFPMIDARLLDFSMQLPVSYKLRRLKLRWFFKEALRGFLPDEILVKRKQGFGLPFGVWTTRHEGLRQLAGDALGSLQRRGIVRPEYLQTLLGSRLAEHPGYYGEMVWILMMLEHWLRGSLHPDFAVA
jgi:asparagine synthase (glutamine-hydrolysing)